jgi:plasmid stabilization system protein ParE
MQVIFTRLREPTSLLLRIGTKLSFPASGRVFREEVGETVLRMRENPYQFPIVLRDVHRARLRRFPYGLFFRVEMTALVVIACFHGSRDPQRWERRV